MSPARRCRYLRPSVEQYIAGTLFPAHRKDPSPRPEESEQPDRMNSIGYWLSMRKPVKWLSASRAEILISLDVVAKKRLRSPKRVFRLRLSRESLLRLLRRLMLASQLHIATTPHQSLCYGTFRCTAPRFKLNWEQLATAVDTLVVYMGVAHLRSIVERLIAHGRDPHTPVSLVRVGTTPHSTSSKAPLDTIVEKVATANLKVRQLSLSER